MRRITIHDASLVPGSQFDLGVLIEEEGDTIRFNLSTEPEHWREVNRYRDDEDWQMLKQFLKAVQRLVHTNAGMP